MNLATEMRKSSLHFAQTLSTKNKEEQARRRKQEAEALKQQMEEAPRVAARVIADLPEFLESIAAKRHCAYVLNRSACVPYENKYPDYEYPSRNADTKELSEYKIRRYLRGTIQHVARWGIKQGFEVGLTRIHDHDVESWKVQQQQHDTPFPVYIPGMLGWIPDGNSEVLFFAW